MTGGYVFLQGRQLLKSSPSMERKNYENNLGAGGIRLHRQFNVTIWELLYNLQLLVSTIEVTNRR